MVDVFNGIVVYITLGLLLTYPDIKRDVEKFQIEESFEIFYIICLNLLTWPMLILDFILALVRYKK